MANTFKIPMRCFQRQLDATPRFELDRVHRAHRAVSSAALEAMSA